MALRVAPCSRCKAPIVFGQRQCGNCALHFDYGPSPPPRPSAAAVTEALAAAGGSPAQNKEPAAGAMPGLDIGRYDEVGDVTPEAIPGFIDSTLFAAYTPAHVDVQAVDGLMMTCVADTPTKDTTAMPGLLPTELGATGAVSPEAIPGFIDSTLFAAFTPKEVSRENIAGLQLHPGAGAELPDDSADEDERLCGDCGCKYHGSMCPNCGAR